MFALVCWCTLEALFANIVFPNKTYFWSSLVRIHSFCFRFFVLFDLILYVPSTISQLNRDGGSWVEPVLSCNKCVLLKDHSAVMPVRLEPAAPRSRVKHSTTEPLRSRSMKYMYINIDPYFHCKMFQEFNLIKN